MAATLASSSTSSDRDAQCAPIPRIAHEHNGAHATDVGRLVESSYKLRAYVAKVVALGASPYASLFDRPALSSIADRVTLGEPARREFADGCQPLDVVNLATSGYLGLGTDPRVRAAARAAIDQFGTHTGGSRVLSGTTEPHFALEERLARFLGADAVVCYSSGYAANVSVVSALFGPGDLVMLDRAAHRSLYDGAVLSRAAVKRFAHNDLDHLERLLGKTAHVRRRLIAVDAVYSMEGTIAPVPALVDLARRHDAFLLVDEAHAIGVLGEHGSGIVSHFGLPPDAIDIRMGTLSKALAAAGGFAAVSAGTGVALRYGSASRVFSAAMTPADTAAALMAVEIVATEPERVARVRANADRLRHELRSHALTVLGDGTAIVPIAVNDHTATLEAATRLLAAGFFVNPVVAPGVPAGRERLRCLVSALHRDADLDAAAAAIAIALRA